MPVRNAKLKKSGERWSLYPQSRVDGSASLLHHIIKTSAGTDSSVIKLSPTSFSEIHNPDVPRDAPA
jgi:hypothetical protein